VPAAVPTPATCARGLFAYRQGVAGARVFARDTPESTLWCENSHSMVEIAANRSNAAPAL